MWVGKELQKFAYATRGLSQGMLSPGATRCGLLYDENETPHYTVPDWRCPSPFFLQQLGLIHNTLVELERDGAPVDGPLLEMWFLKPFECLRKTGTVTLHLVFICICWIRSVAALQGNRGLGRTVSLSILDRWDLRDRIDQLLISMTSPRHGEDHFVTELKAIKGKIDLVDCSPSLHRANPILAGCVQIDLDVKFLEVGNDSLLMTPFFRAFCHIYSAFRSCAMIDEIPFVEGVIRVYEGGVFTPSRASVAHGSYARSYLAAKSLASTSFVVQHVRKTADEWTKTAFDRVRLIRISPAFRLLYMKDFSVLPSSVSLSSSWKLLLSGVSEVCAFDLFDSRVLSRDMLSFTQTLTTIFHELCDELGRRPQFERMLAGTSPRVAREIAEGLALENAVVFPLLPSLDALTDDEIGDAVKMPLICTKSTRLDKCLRASHLIARHFARIQIEESYFIFPPSPTRASLEFGSPAPADSEPTEAEEDEFHAIMDLMASSSGPLDRKTLADFKCRVRAMPSVLGTGLTSPSVEFNTLLHHCAAGPAHDRHLTEWLIQSGALEAESTHCRFPDEVESVSPSHGEWHWDALAVHCAARKGLTDIVQVILEAGYWRDVNTTTYRTKESLMHIAVKTDNRELFELLANMGAIVSGKDAQGKHVWDLTKDRAWGSHIKRMAVFIDKEDDDAKQRQILADTTPRASVSTMVPTEGCAAVLTQASSAIVAAPGGGAKKTKKKKKKKKQNRSASSSGVESASALMDQLFVSESARAGPDESSRQRFSRALETLRPSAVCAPEEREAAATTITELLVELTTIVDSVVKVSGVSSVSAHVPELQEIAHVLFVLEAFRASLGDLCPLEVDKQLLMHVPADGGYYNWYELAIKTALLSAWCGETTTIEKLVVLAEGWLLQIPERSGKFRDMVDGYIHARRMGRLLPPLGSTREAERQFQWYASNHGVDNADELRRLDGLHGCIHYVTLKISDAIETSCVESWAELIDATPFGDEVIWISDSIIAGARSRERFVAIVRAIGTAAKSTGVRFILPTDVETSTMQFEGFEFSANGIVPISSR